MFSKFWLVNVVLAAGAVFFAIKTHDVWFDEREETSSPAQVEKKRTEVEKKFDKPNLPSESYYRTVVDKDLFSDERTEYLPPEPEPEPVEEVDAEPEPEPEPEPEVKPLEGYGRRITLYGVVLFGDLKKALISNASRKRGDPKDVWVEKGDVVLEVKKRDEVAVLRVDDILEDRILVKDDANRYEVLLYDRDNPKKRPTVRKAAKPEVVAPKAAPDKRKARKKIAKKKRPRERRRVPKRAARDLEKKRGDESRFEIINTPFGEIKRRKKKTR